MIGRRGESLDALQYLSTLVACKNSEERVRVVLDIGGYRRRREASLVSLAERTAAKVARSALQNAASIAGLLLTTECMVTEIPEKKEAPAPNPGMGGMDM